MNVSLSRHISQHLSNGNILSFICYTFTNDYLDIGFFAEPYFVL